MTKISTHTSPPLSLQIIIVLCQVGFPDILNNMYSIYTMLSEMGCIENGTLSKLSKRYNRNGLCSGVEQTVERERDVLFNDALNTFYLRLYGVRHMVKDHSDSEKGNPLPPYRLLLSINSKGSFICTIPQT